MNRPLAALSDLEAESHAFPATRRVVIVANPVAGNFRQATLDAIAARLATAGASAEVRLTRHAGDMTDLAANLSADVDTLLVGGGDGSISEAVAGLLARDLPAPALGIVPAGTANVLAHELGLPFRATAIAKAAMARRLKPLHPGLIGERPFILMVSAGFDGDVVHGVDSDLKRRWGKLAFAAVAVKQALARAGRDVIVEADGETIRCRLAVATTARCYGGPMTLTRHTDVTRPGLRLVTLDDDRPGRLALAAINLALGRLERSPGVVDRPVTSLCFRGDGIRMQIDGDAVATTPAVVTAGARMLQVIVP